MGIEPGKVKHIRKASEKGLGSMEAQVLGEKIANVERVFKAAKD
jgi:hypothetical protein